MIPSLSLFDENLPSDFNEEQIMETLKKLEDVWHLNTKRNKYIVYQIGPQNFFSSDERDENGMPDENIGLDIINIRHKSILNNLFDMYSRAQELDILEKEDDEQTSVSFRINRLVDHVNDQWEIILNANHCYDRINNPKAVPIYPETDPKKYRRSIIGDTDECTPYQKSLIEYLRILNKNKYKRYKGQVYSQIKTHDNVYTKSWKHEYDMEDYVYSVPQKIEGPLLWKLMTSSKGLFKEVANYLMKCHDRQFSDIVKDRHTWSFKNGILIGKNWNSEKNIYDSVFHPYDSPQFKKLPPNVVSCRYFDLEYEDYSHYDEWYDIPTPAVQSILEYQGFSKDVCEWVYIMSGRCFFDVGEMDTWQIIPFFKGVAGTGKSSIVDKFVGNVYERQDCGTLGNNIERKFGLSAIYDKLLFIAPELKGDLCLEQAEFQSMVSGENISVAVKNEKARTVKWTTPGILGGNEIPNWNDNSGSIVRRIMVWNFMKCVADEDKDPLLEFKIMEEMPNLIQKCLRAYLNAAQKFNGNDIWKCVPEYFKIQKESLERQTHSLESFLYSDDVELDPTKFCTMSYFKTYFDRFCVANSFSRRKLNQDLYQKPFSNKNIRVEKCGESKHKIMYEGDMVEISEAIKNKYEVEFDGKPLTKNTEIIVGLNLNVSD